MKYIVNADDFGRTETVNQAIVEGFKNGCLDRTTIMVNMPFFEQAVQLANEYGFQNNVGLHLNLTSGIPLTDDIKKCKVFCDDAGRFNGSIFKNHREQFFLTLQEKKAVRKELEAQIKKYLDFGFDLMHADSHGHVHTFPSLCGLVLNVLKKYNFKSVRISLNVVNSKFKQIYKKILNAKLNGFNKRQGKVCLYFAPFKEMSNISERLHLIDGFSEIMLHPNIYDGSFVIGQALHFPDILQWKERYKE